MPVSMVARGWWLAVVFATALFPAFSTTADEGLHRVSGIKAAFVLNVARFVTWPPESATARDKLVLCFYRNNILAGAEQTVTQDTVAGRAVDSRIIQHLDDAEGCDVLLIPGSQVQRFVRESSLISKRPILTIADLTSADNVGLAYPGVHVNLIRRGNKIGVEVNPNGVNDAGLRVSSSLLKLARIVGGGM